MGTFCRRENNLFTNETLVEIGKKYNKTAAQIALRYLIQRDVVVIPKTVRKERMIQNFDVFNFELNEEDMKEILKLDKKESLFLSHYDPETVKLLVNYKI